MDGTIQIYKLGENGLTNNNQENEPKEEDIEPELFAQFTLAAPSVAQNERACSKVAWKPQEACFAFPTRAREISVYEDGLEKTKLYGFRGQHISKYISDFCWSPNGNILLSAGTEQEILLWESAGQTVLRTLSFGDVSMLAWHPLANTVSFTTYKGQIYTYPDILPPELAHRLLLDEDSSNEAEAARDVDSDAAWIEDDDGAGYVPTEEQIMSARKRYFGQSVEASPNAETATKRVVQQQSLMYHPPIDSGSTPWKGNRRYLVLNSIGQIWTVKQEASHNTITVEFVDQDAHKKYHFMDPDMFSMARLSNHGALFASEAPGAVGSVVMYRPHESWSVNADWRLTLPDGEECVAMALTEKHIVICSNEGTVRVFLTSGAPVKMIRFKYQPVISCAAGGDAVAIVGNGSIGADGHAELRYSIYSLNDDSVLQSGDLIALQPGARLQAMFYSAEGDPYIYDSNEVLLVLQHWRIQGQAEWVPILDTRLLGRRERNEEYYWPVAVENNQLHCVILKVMSFQLSSEIFLQQLLSSHTSNRLFIKVALLLTSILIWNYLKGKDRNPYFPRPIISELDLQVPFASRLPESSETARLEEALIRELVLLSLYEDQVPEETDAEIRFALQKMKLNIDKIILQQIQIACKEDRGEKALGLVGLLHNKSSKEAARKIALHYDNTSLAERIS